MIDFRTNERRSRIALYRALATAQGSGLPLHAALRILGGSGGPPWLASVESALQRGISVADALASVPKLPVAHRAAIAAAERAGHLVECLTDLAAEEEAAIAEERRLWTACAYPLLVLHLVVPAVSTSILLTNPGRFLLRVVLATAAIWIALFAIVGISRRLLNSPRGTARLARVPLVGPVLRRGAHLRFLRTLRQLYAAGVAFPTAITDARFAVGASLAAPDLDDVRRRAARQDSMEQVLEGLTGLEPLMRAELVTAAHTGDLEPALRRVVDRIGEQQLAAVQRLTRLAGSAIYVLAVLAVAAAAVSFYGGYYGDIRREYERAFPRH